MVQNCPACGTEANPNDVACKRCGQKFGLSTDHSGGARSIGAANALGAIAGLAIPFFGVIFMLGTCSVDQSRDEPAVSSVNDQAMSAEAQLDHAINVCENGAMRSDPSGKYALAEVDIAMADNIENVSPDQELRIRQSIGAEMGIAPSEVNGWKDIYRGRAESARKLLQERDKELQQTRTETCDSVDGLRDEVKSEKMLTR